MFSMLGFDVPLAEVAICVVDEHGTIEFECTAPSESDAIADWLLAHDAHPEKVGLEIGDLARWPYTKLAHRGLPMICIAPRRLRALTKAKPVKTDRNDANAIAQVIRVGWYRPVHIKSPIGRICACCSPTADPAGRVRRYLEQGVRHAARLSV